MRESTPSTTLLGTTSHHIVGVDFGAPRRARDQRRKIIAIAAQAVADRRYRVDAIDMNERLLASDPPGWTSTELLDALLTRTVRIAAFDFPFSVPDVLLRDEEFAASAGHTHGAFIGWRTFNAFQATFQMTLLGNAVLSRLWESRRYRILPFPGGRGAGEVPTRGSDPIRHRRLPGRRRRRDVPNGD